MALTLVGSIGGEAVRLYLDVVSNRVVAVSVVNDAAWTARIVVVRASSGTPIASEDVPGGTTVTRNLPNNRRFDYDDVLADWGYSLTPLGG
jgi:hypothetical protein